MLTWMRGVRGVGGVRGAARRSSGAGARPGGAEVKAQYDVIIAGGGMVGCTLACALAKNPFLSKLRILLLEGSPKQSFTLKPEYSNRVVSLNQNTKALMSSINVWKKVQQMRVHPVKNMQVWDACSDALITFDSADIKEDVSYIVENDVLLHAINSELDTSACGNINIVYGARINGYHLPERGSLSTESRVNMDNGDVYSCRLLIGADGANSQVRKTMGVQYLSWNYDQMGVVATLQLAEDCENSTAWQRFLPTGPVALLPLCSGSSSLVWSTSIPHAKQLLQMPEEQFVDQLNDALWKQYPRSSLVDSAVISFGKMLRAAGLPEGSTRQLPPSIAKISPGSRAAFPLGFGHSTRYVASGVALIGDAAHRVHPLAGQGVNLGFGDVKELVRLLGENVYRGENISNSTWLEEYESARQCHNVPTQAAIEALHRLYSVEATPAVLLRSLGLQLTHALAPVKKAIMAHATA